MFCPKAERLLYYRIRDCRELNCEKSYYSKREIVDMLKKLVFILVVISVLLCCTSCNEYFYHPYVHPDLVWERFSTLEPKNRACLTDGCYLYIGNFSCSYDYLLSYVPNKENTIIYCAIVCNSKIYAVARCYTKGNDSIYVVEFDYQNNQSPVVIFEKELAFYSADRSSGYSNGILTIHDTKYLGLNDTKEYYHSYIIETGEFIEGASENEFERWYDISYNNTRFKITDKRTCITKIVNAETVANSGYADVFSGMYYYPVTYCQNGDSIALAYRIKASTNNGLNLVEDGYFFAFFTYNFETEVLEFDSLLYPKFPDGISFSYNVIPTTQ